MSLLLYYNYYWKSRSCPWTPESPPNKISQQPGQIAGKHNFHLETYSNQRTPSRQEGYAIQPRYNIAIIGRTGVGKSSLTNYLFGMPLRTEGAGRPATEPGFHPVEFQFKDLPIRVYDSWGLEVSNYKAWRLALERELDKRSYTSEIDQWFHAVFYCCSVGDSRIHDFELELIRDLMSGLFQVTVIFTKADLATSVEIETLQKLLDREFDNKVPVIPVCSKQGEFQNRIIKPFGYKQVITQAARSFWLTMAQRLPKRCLLQINEEIDQFAHAQRTFIRQEVGLLGTYSSNFPTRLETRVQNFIADLEGNRIQEIIGAEMEKAQQMYRAYAQALDMARVEPVLQGIDLSPKRGRILPPLALAQKIRHLLLLLLVPGRLLFQKQITTDNIIREFDKVMSVLKTQIQALEQDLENNISGTVEKELQKYPLQRYLENLGRKLSRLLPWR